MRSHRSFSIGLAMLAAGCSTGEGIAVPSADPAAVLMVDSTCNFPVVEFKAYETLTVSWANVTVDINGQAVDPPGGYDEGFHGRVFDQPIAETVAVCDAGAPEAFSAVVRIPHTRWITGDVEFDATSAIIEPFQLPAPGQSGMLWLQYDSHAPPMAVILLHPTDASLVTELVFE